MSGPSATEKPMSAKIAVSSSITWLIGWMSPRVSGPSRTGRLTSMRSAARRCSSAASPSASLRVAIAPWTLSRSPLISGPLALRSSGVMAPRVFRSSETVPFLPSAEMRTASSAASSGAPWTSLMRSRSRVERSVMDDRPDASVLSIRTPAPSSVSEGAQAHGGPNGPPGRRASGCWETPSRWRRSAALGRCLEGGKRRFGALHISPESRGLVDRHLGQKLPVDLDPSLAEAVDKSRVGQPMLAHRRIEALDPERPERALAVLAVPVGVLHRAVDGRLGGPDRVLAPAVEAFRGLEGLLVLGVARHAAFHARHG